MLNKFMKNAKFKLISWFTGASLINLLCSAEAFAAQASRQEIILIKVFMVTAALSIIIGLGLAYFSKKSGSHKGLLYNKEKTVFGHREGAVGTEGSLSTAVYREIMQVSGSGHSRRRAAESLLAAFNRELENKKNIIAQQISSKYEKVITQKEQQVEVAHKKYRRVLSEKKQTEAVIRSIAEGLVVINQKGEVVLMNPAAERIFGVSKKNKIGRPLLEDLKEEQLVSMVKESPLSGNKEIELACKQDATKKVLRSSGAVIENENGETVGMVSVVTDVTKQKELEQAKSNFVSHVSHELRTPLVSIQKSLAVMLDKTAGPISQTQEQFLNMAMNNIRRLSVMINDLLDLSKLEAGRMVLKPRPASVADIIEEVILNLSAWANSKNIKFYKRISPDIPLVKLDPDKIIQVLNNLVGNALKFTPAGGSITIEARLLDNNRQVQVSVADTGIGIPKENLSKIFDKFFQVTERASGDINGTGLGLSIAKEIIGLHKGKIWAESEEGKGTRFIFTIPLDK
jgi:PAS domain S-box-containing protein